jgi:hypothetical protein
MAALPVPIGCEALERPNRHGREFGFAAQQACPFTIELVLADAATDTRERVLFDDRPERRAEIAVYHWANETLDVNVQRTGLDAFGMLAVEATEDFDPNLALGESQGTSWQVDTRLSMSNCGSFCEGVSGSAAAGPVERLQADAPRLPSGSIQPALIFGSAQEPV